MRVIMLFKNGTWIERQEITWYYNSPEWHRIPDPKQTIDPTLENEPLSTYITMIRFKKLIAHSPGGTAIYEEIGDGE